MLATAMPQAAANSATCAGLGSSRGASLSRVGTGEERFLPPVIEFINAFHVATAHACASVAMACEAVPRAFRRHSHRPAPSFQLACPCGLSRALQVKRGATSATSDRRLLPLPSMLRALADTLVARRTELSGSNRCQVLRSTSKMI